MHLERLEIEAINELSEEVARRFAVLRLEGARDQRVTWRMRDSRISCDVRRSGQDATWYNAITGITRHDCCMMGGRRLQGRLVSARFDADVFSNWLAEEIEETLIRFEIISRQNASRNGTLRDMIVKRALRGRNVDNPLGVEL